MFLAQKSVICTHRNCQYVEYSVLCTLYELQIFIRPFQACIWSNFSFLNRLPKEYLAGLLILIPVHIQQQRKRSKESCQMINSNRITIDGLSTSL